MTFAAILAVLKTVGSSVFSFFAKPPGSYAGLILAGLLLLAGVHHHGYAAGRSACQAAHHVAQAAEVQRQTAAGVAAAHRSDVQSAQDKAKDKTNQETIRYVVKTVYAQPDAGTECIPAAVADRLRLIE